MSQVTSQHRADSPRGLHCAVLTVSDTRTPETDTGGKAIVDLLSAAGHQIIAREIIPDEPERMSSLVAQWAAQGDIDAILLTGGTGSSSRDQTFETISGLLTKPLPGYGELFRMLSFAEVGSAAMLSRAVGGLMGRTVVLTMPGSPAAVRLAMERLILPELGHLVREVPVEASVQDYLVRIVRATHPTDAQATDRVKKYVRHGSSPRGAQTILAAARVHALLDDRYHVAREDIAKAAIPALRHRILLSFEGEAEGVKTDEIIGDVLAKVKE